MLSGARVPIGRRRVEAHVVAFEGLHKTNDSAMPLLWSDLHCWSEVPRPKPSILRAHGCEIRPPVGNYAMLDWSIVNIPRVLGKQLAAIYAPLRISRQIDVVSMVINDLYIN